MTSVENDVNIDWYQLASVLLNQSDVNLEALVVPQFLGVWVVIPFARREPDVVVNAAFDGRMNR